MFESSSPCKGNKTSKGVLILKHIPQKQKILGFNDLLRLKSTFEQFSLPKPLYPLHSQDRSIWWWFPSFSVQPLHEEVSIEALRRFRLPHPMEIRQPVYNREPIMRERYMFAHGYRPWGFITMLKIYVTYCFSKKMIWQNH